jgi:hypothetical protein
VARSSSSTTSSSAASASAASAAAAAGGRRSRGRGGARGAAVRQREAPADARHRDPTIPARRQPGRG